MENKDRRIQNVVVWLYLYADNSFKDGVIHSHWVVLFSCRPQEIRRLEAISRRLGKFAVKIKSYDSRFYKEE